MPHRTTEFFPSEPAPITWVRLLDGRERDPQLGRDVLIGCLLGADYAVLLQAPILVLWHVCFFRFGWVTILVGTFTADPLLGFPLTSDLSARHAYATVVAVGACLALAGWGFLTSLGGWPAFRGLLAESLSQAGRGRRTSRTADAVHPR